MTKIITAAIPRGPHGEKDPNDWAMSSPGDLPAKIGTGGKSLVEKRCKLGRHTDASVQVGPKSEYQQSEPDHSEDGLALQFAAMHRDLRWIGDRACWFHWDGTVWRKDSTLKAFDRIRELIRSIAGGMSEKESAILKKAATVSAVERLSRSDRRLIARTDQFDADPWKLNTPGGVVDLKTGETQPHSLADYFTKITHANPNGECPLWMKFLDEVTEGDAELIAFLQRVIGYCLTGSVREHALFFLYGTGRNGKGVFLNTISDLLGDYAAIASMEVLTETKGDRHPTELAAMQGKRLVVAQEVDEGRNWAEAKIKTLTGGDPITARFMRRDFFTFTPQFKLLIAANHKPVLRNVDEAMRSRLHLVPFTVTIPKDKRDPDLQDKLKAEWEGILQWALDGALQYQETGLAPPDAVTQATQEYFSDQDIFTQWVDECCEVGRECWEMPSLLFASWQAYAHAANLAPGSRPSFKERLTSAGFEHRRSGARGRHHVGLKLKPTSIEDWRNEV